MKHLISLALCLVAVFSVYAQGPNNSGTYYKNADGCKGSALKTALAGIISNHTTLSYSSLWDYYKKTDLRSDGKIWDMYSNATNYDPDKDRAGSYTKEGDVFNREHSFPKSWFDDASPMVTDLMHIIPTDGFVNGRRSNYPFGETDGDEYKSSGDFSKLGTSKIAEYSGTVFEPNDEYKGDFARIYFYMVTCYESKVSSWSCDMLAGNKYPAFKTWALNMLLRWAKNDPVSEKEIARNKAVYGIQGNRNPFVDYPGLEQYVWGDSTNVTFSYDNYQQVSSGDVTPGGGDNTGGDNTGGENTGGEVTPGGDDNPDVTPAEGEQQYELITSASDLKNGNGYLIVYVDGNVALSDYTNSKYFAGADVTISNNQINTVVDKTGYPHQLILCGQAGSYTFYDAVEKAYLSLGSSSNALNTSDSAVDNENALWTISISNGKTDIKNNAYTDRTIQYNSSSPRFACYKSSQQSVSLFGSKASTGINDVINQSRDNTSAIFDMQGRKIDNVENYNLLPRGVYIISGRKVVKTN